VRHAGILATPLIESPLLLWLGVLSIIAAVYLLVRRRSTKSWWRLAITLVSGLLVGWAFGWLVGTVITSGDLQLTPTTLGWASVGVAAIGLAASNFWGSRRRRKTIASIAIVLFLATSASGINADVGEFPTLGALVGREYSRLDLPPLVGPAEPSTFTLAQSWEPPAGMPTTGVIGSALIRGISSGFHPRAALIYLPPAARVAHPPRLPVLVMLSGQPGGPTNIFSTAQLGNIFTEFAAEHGGLAPIVVVPDQLAESSANPMCLDSPLGNSASYLTKDVPNWINKNLNVLPGPANWGIGGFSQGGTCAIQLGATHPQLFGSILDISGESAPKRGSEKDTIRDAFHGSREAYEAAKPSALLAANAPYNRMLAIFAVGADDVVYRPGIMQVASDARTAGMKVIQFDGPLMSHDWRTVQYSLRRGLPILAENWGLTY
jgi:S-formylglutathione hydrolase FrmB